MTFMGYVEVHLMDLALQRGNELHKFTKVQLQLNTFRIANLQIERLFIKICRLVSLKTNSDIAI